MSRVVSFSLVVALLSFAHTCALHGGALCPDPAAAAPVAHVSQDAADHDRNCDHDGCDRPGAPCAHASICCSTWASAPAPAGVPAPLAIPSAMAVGASSPGTDAAFAPGPVPIPAESPPPLPTVLRL